MRAFRAGPVRLAHSVFGESASIAHGRTPVLVLHGLLGSGRNWRTLAEKMATGMQRLVYTLANYSYSCDIINSIHSYAESQTEVFNGIH